MTSITIHRIANGKLVEKWSEKDMMPFLQQIGVLPRIEHWAGGWQVILSSRRPSLRAFL